MNKTAWGRRGEETAVRLLRENGYRIIGRNVRARFGEIDVVAKQGGAWCFIEVKTRRSVRMGWPEEGVTPAKQRQLSRLASWYLKFHRLQEIPIRFDVVSVLLDQDGGPARTRLIKGAFEAI